MVPLICELVLKFDFLSPLMTLMTFQDFQIQITGILGKHTFAQGMLSHNDRVINH